MGPSEREGGGGAEARAPVDGVFRGAHPGATAWRVRAYDNSDYATIVDIQADSFHEPGPIAPLNGLAFSFFRAEVVDAMRQKLKYSNPDSFQLLVAEELPAAAAAGADGAGVAGQEGLLPVALGPARGQAVVGVVEVSVQDLPDVLYHLPAGASDYAYISSMAVHQSHRRKGVAQALLQAAELQAARWRKQHVALHVHAVNEPAVQLYKGCGLAVVSEDPGWKGMLGIKPKLLLYKSLGSFSEADSG